MGLLEQIARAIGVAENVAAVGADAQRAVDRALDLVEERNRAAEADRRRQLRAARRSPAPAGAEGFRLREPARMTVPPALERRLERLARIASRATGKIVTPTILLGLLVDMAERAAVQQAGERIAVNGSAAR